MARVFIDTNVLFSVTDLMLALTEDGVHEIARTQALLAEWERIIVREHRRSPESAASVTAAIPEFLAQYTTTARSRWLEHRRHAATQHRGPT